MMPFASCHFGPAAPLQEDRESAYGSKEYEDFLNAELATLGERLMQKHLQVADRHVAQHADDAGRERRQSLTEKAEDPPQPDPFKDEIADVTAIVPQFVSTPTATPLERWAAFSSELLEREEAGVAEEEETHKFALVHKHILDLRGPWKLSYHAARTTRRKRTDSAMESRRFNEIFLEESCLQRFVLCPESRIQLGWALAATVLIVWDMITIPLEFFPLTEFASHVDNVALASLVFWMLDVPLHLVFGVQMAGVTEMRPKKLFKLYLQSWFAVDMMIIFVDTVVLTLKFIYSSDPNPVFRSGRFLRSLRIIRLVRLIRVAKLERKVSFVANRLLSTYSLMALKVCGYLAVMLAINHLIACGWYGVAYWTSDLGNWLEGASINADSTPDAYVAAMHWSLTQFTPATNPIAPFNGWERFYAIWVILLAMASFSSFIGSIGSTVSSMRAARRGQILEQGKLELFFTERQLSLALFSKVKAALRDDRREQVRLRESEVSLIQGIPERYKVELHKEMFMHALAQANIWPRWIQREEPYFYSSVCHQTMTEHACRAGQDVYLPRTSCCIVYALQTGCMEFVDDDVKTKPVECEPDTVMAVVCLPSLWTEWEHTGRLTAKSGVCHYAGIDCNAFCNLATNFGGKLCEYLKVLGILILGEIESKEGEGIRVSDVSVPSEIPLDGLAPRAEQFAFMRSRASAGTESSVSASVRSTARGKLL